MNRDAALKEALARAGRVTAERLELAERYARDEGLSFTRALAALGMADAAELGKQLAAITGLPQAALPGPAAAASTAHMLSKPCAQAWGAFPAAYDARERRLTFAVSDPDRAELLTRVYSLFMQPYVLDFAVASDVEIEGAIGQYLGKAPEPAAPAVPAAEAPAPVPAAPAAPAAAAPPPAAPGPAADGADMYGQVRGALLSTAGQLVRAHLGQESDRLAQTRERVRYCQLVASKLKLPPLQADALALAAWLAALRDRRDLLGQLSLPYGLEDILFMDRGLTGGRPEAWVLSLVERYHDLRAAQPDASRDINLVRRELRGRWSPLPEHQPVLEAFLQVLVDEEFINTLGRATGRVLVIDPEESRLCLFTPALINAGYEVSVFADIRAAQDALADALPHVLIVDIAAFPDESLNLIRRLRESPGAGRLHILALIPPNADTVAIAALCAGADDFLARPLNAELLFLKIEACQARGGPQASSSAGVSGSLSDMGFTDMIQILCAGRRSTRIVLARAEQQGEVWVRDGEIIDARVGDLGGEAAFYALMRWTDGTFTTRPCSEYPPRTLQRSAMSLLMEGARQADESAGA